jgi:methyl coenzyme M reductase beta subunit
MAVDMRFPVLRDVVERAVSTGVQTALAVLTADGVNLLDLRDLTLWQGAGLAGLGAAWALVKAVVAVKIGKKGASLDPKVGLQPTATTGTSDL